MASSDPATSSKVTFGVSLVTSFARDLPNCMTLLPPPCMPEIMIQKNTPISSAGIRKPRMLTSQFGCGTSSS